MSSVKCALVLVALLALGVGLGQASFCSTSLDACFLTYRGSSKITSEGSCTPYTILKGCVSTLTGPGTCSQSDVDNHSDIQGAYRDNMSCSGTTLPKASLIGILIAAVVGLLFRA